MQNFSHTTVQEKDEKWMCSIKKSMCIRDFQS